VLRRSHAGTLSRRDADRVEEALADDRELVQRYELVREELSATIHLNEVVGAPSKRPMEKLFAAIDAGRLRPERIRCEPSCVALDMRIFLKAGSILRRAASSPRELVAEHRQAAPRLLARGLVLDHVPVLGQLAVLEAHDIHHDPVRRQA
jgi:hypothetical protein